MLEVVVDPAQREWSKEPARVHYGYFQWHLELAPNHAGAGLSGGDGLSCVNRLGVVVLHFCGGKKPRVHRPRERARWKNLEDAAAEKCEGKKHHTSLPRLTKAPREGCVHGCVGVSGPFRAGDIKRKRAPVSR